MFGNDLEIVEVPTPAGVITFVMHYDHVPPFRCYGPDGIEVDPAFIARMTHDDHTHGCCAYDLSRFDPRRKKGR